jgi:hypothetical protein
MKLDKYYRTVRDSPVYCILAFDGAFLKERWGGYYPAWVEEAKED